MTAIDDIEDFLALARLGSFTKAARERHVSQPAFTRRIKQLEEGLLAPLFDRSTTPVGLTGAGRCFLSYAKTLSRTFTQAVNETRAASSQLGDPVRLVSTHTLAIAVFPRIWKACQAAHPTLRVALSGQRTERCVSDLREGATDLAFIHAAPEETKRLAASGIEILKVWPDSLVPVLGRHAKDKLYKMLAYTPDIALGSLVAARLPSELKDKIDVVFENPSSEVLKAMALAGLGLAYLPRCLVEDEILDGFLDEANPPYPTIFLDILALRLPDNKSPEAALLWGCLSEAE